MRCFCAITRRFLNRVRKFDSCRGHFAHRTAGRVVTAELQCGSLDRPPPALRRAWRDVAVADDNGRCKVQRTPAPRQPEPVRLQFLCGLWRLPADAGWGSGPAILLDNGRNGFKPAVRLVLGHASRGGGPRGAEAAVARHGHGCRPWCGGRSRASSDSATMTGLANDRGKVGDVTALNAQSVTRIGFPQS